NSYFTNVTKSRARNQPACAASECARQTQGRRTGRSQMMRLSLLGGLLPIKPRGAVRDALAGLTLASMNIPQVLGYTRIAGTPVVTGLYTVLLPLVAFATFGSSRHLVVAADSATAAIFASSLSG